ncbi:SGNH/GDSL hydrolase family protein [Algoriphagus sp. AK58]|uniref:SGNH/GDSL hydrolase family protein n=1 Tax=Algoriphagus sp. AK58 TaxID=1406877 RepID=UPI00165089FF|nr:SGNH/GDSL hydrolase family protein [Algoriphagus sp. AK58]MBC6369103.1 hypothetical protein [Algoriphagus sp. AK58]
MYWLFKLKLIPNLPFLISEAAKIRENGVKLSPVSEYARFGIGKEKILILGESTAAGVGASSIEDSLAGYFSRLFGNQYTVENFGKNGLTAKDAYSLLEFSYPYRPDKIKGLMLFLGANDCFKLTSPSDFQNHLKELITRISSENQPEWIYLADIPPVHLFPAFSAKMKAFLRIQRDFLQKEMIKVSRENSKIVFEPISLDLSPDFFSEDQVHPSDLGYHKIAKFAFEELIRRKTL